LEPRAISEEKNKVFRSMLPIQPTDVVRGQYTGYRDEPGVRPDSETETFIALKCFIDNWRWAGVPFYLRTGKRMAEGQRIISIAFREPPKSMFPPGSGVGDHGPRPPHLRPLRPAEDVAVLLRQAPRPGHEARQAEPAVRDAGDRPGPERCARGLRAAHLDAMPSGDRTLFTTAEGIERLWEISQPLIDNPPVVRPYAPGTWGPNQIHQLIAPASWRLPFERPWREKKP
jgi:glucose-6-phosphate 1-dehydrogenase